MQPVPCIHCGYNYMRRTTEPDVVRLCNSCEVRENQRNPKGENKMQTIDILIKVPQKEYIDIEEYCINNGIDSIKYFLSLHNDFKSKTDAYSEPKYEPKTEDQINSKTQISKGKKR